MSNEATLNFKSDINNAPIYVSGASIEETQQAYEIEDIIKMSSNENPLPPSPLAIGAMQQTAATANRYPSAGDEKLRTTLAETIGQGLEPDNFVTGNGGCNVLEMIATAFMSPGDECVICRPTFPVYDITARRVGANVVYVDLDPEHFSYDMEAILDAVTEQTRLIYICNPNNPSGTITTAEQMETLVNNVPPHVLIVSDEVYHHFVTSDDFPNSLAFVKAEKNIVILHSFSKAYGLAGLRLGYAIAPIEIARYLSRARNSFHLSQVTIDGGVAALRDTAHLEKGIELIIAGRDWLYEQLVGLDLQVQPSQANFILFKSDFAPQEVSERLLQRGVIIRPMDKFSLPTHLRVTVGLPEENQRFIATIREVLADMEAEGVSKDVPIVEDSTEFKF